MNRLFTILTSRTATWIGRIASLGVFSYSWYSFTTHYDLSQLDDTPSFRFAVLVIVTSLWGTAQLGAVLTWRIASKPLPVDPDFPPTKMVYLQGEGEPERCTCHNRPIEDGTEIWHWPQPAKLVCVKKGHAK
jgi:hypothetical protein